jgi:hypothetical protein
MELKPSIKFKCKKCYKTLFTNLEIVLHDDLKGQHDTFSTRSKETITDDDKISVVAQCDNWRRDFYKCTNIFTFRPEWHDNEPEICCPNCKIKLGIYRAEGLTC